MMLMRRCKYRGLVKSAKSQFPLIGTLRHLGIVQHERYTILSVNGEALYLALSSIFLPVMLLDLGSNVE
jgi:hypothetical protein